MRSCELIYHPYFSLDREHSFSPQKADHRFYSHLIILFSLFPPLLVLSL